MVQNSNDSYVYSEVASVRHTQLVPWPKSISASFFY